MKVLGWMVAAAGMAFALPAQAAVGDPELTLYRFPGVTDDGGSSSSGVATAVHCTNFSGVPETLRFVVRNFDSTLIANQPALNGHHGTVTVTTHLTDLYR